MPGLRTTAIGKLLIKYTFLGEEATTSVTLADGADPFDDSQMAGIALTLAPLLQACMPSVGVLYGWKSLTSEYLEARFGAFPSVYAGTHSTIPFVAAYESTTATITGATADPTSGHRIEQTLMRFRVGSTIALVSGERVFPVSADAAYQDLYDALYSAPLFFADKSGRKANPRSDVQVQYNAYYQNRRGT